MLGLGPTPDACSRHESHLEVQKAWLEYGEITILIGNYITCANRSSVTLEFLPRSSCDFVALEVCFNVIGKTNHLSLCAREKGPAVFGGPVFGTLPTRPQPALAALTFSFPPHVQGFASTVDYCSRFPHSFCISISLPPFFRMIYFGSFSSVLKMDISQSTYGSWLTVYLGVPSLPPFYHSQGYICLSQPGRIPRDLLLGLPSLAKLTALQGVCLSLLTLEDSKESPTRSRCRIPHICCTAKGVRTLVACAKLTRRLSGRGEQNCLSLFHR